MIPSSKALFPSGPTRLNNINLLKCRCTDTDGNSNENEVIKKLQNKKKGGQN